jgi:hypothetical protein
VSFLEKAFCRGFGGLTLLDRGPATGDFFLQPGNSLFQFMRRQGGDVLSQRDIRQLLARLQIVQIHRFPLRFGFSLKPATGSRKP